jgi:hypothetical protein
MKVKLKRDFYDLWKAGVEYPAEPVFRDGRQRVSVRYSSWSICIIVDWEDIESAV